METPKINLNLNEELFRKYWRVLKLARFPKRDEYTKIALVAAAGVLIVGMLGFIVYLLFVYLPK
ncbi:MAG TPA: protein translocase SEC61 complex subunit gamma [Methanospirillum sp.]|uniref:protein translocase SEC61 complex subunit gamma n=1 Tax=Methanospirillum sp. TaxID=45200 RepID=UPI002C605D70|nr:protein translocase SEC61 complex subunit gamma [Methanospirillum sp.]HWQ63773.1 protein translocase SEC61 complex subunit gamma [Methanospirillum sp.]